jgi:hypothetical protein
MSLVDFLPGTFRRPQIEDVAVFPKPGNRRPVSFQPRAGHFANPFSAWQTAKSLGNKHLTGQFATLPTPLSELPNPSGNEHCRCLATKDLAPCACHPSQNLRRLIPGSSLSNCLLPASGYSPHEGRRSALEFLRQLLRGTLAALALPPWTTAPFRLRAPAGRGRMPVADIESPEVWAGGTAPSGTPVASTAAGTGLPRSAVLA